MANQLTNSDVLALAKLARLRLSDDEIARYMHELNDIFEYIKKLDAADTTGLVPTLQVTGLVNITRPDEVLVQDTTPEELLAGAPRSKDGYLQVERMI